MVRCHLSRSVSVAMNPGTLQPALLTSTSRPPHADLGGVDRGFGRPGNRQIGDHHIDVAGTQFLGFGPHLLRLRPVDVVDHDARAFSGERVHDAASDIGGASGDDDPRIRQTEIHVDSSLCGRCLWLSAR